MDIFIYFMALVIVPLTSLQELPKDKWFCCEDCSRVHAALQNLAFRGPEMIPASVSSMINRKHLDKGILDGAADDFQWCILSGKSRYKEHLPLLSRTTAIFRVSLCTSLSFWYQYLCH